MPQRILIVDDDAQVRLLLRHILRRGDSEYEVAEAASGPDALVRVAEWRPHLVLLDLMMPGVNGCAICSALRANPATGNVRIIILTARGDAEARQLCLSAGADDFLVKPLLSQQLMASVKRVLGSEPAPRT